MSRIGFIVAKEIRHILRDPKSLVIIVIMPLLQTLLYGYAVNLDTRNIRLAVVDRDRTESSRGLSQSFLHSGYFIPALRSPGPTGLDDVLRSGEAHAVLVIREGFSEALRAREPYELGLVVDGSDANRAAATTNYSNAVVHDFIRENLGAAVPAASPGANYGDRAGSAGSASAGAEAAVGPFVWISPRVLYNPDLRSPVFFVPGLVAVILMMISALLTSITIAREKESGTMEQLMTAPVSARQIIAGKVIPYIALAFIDGLLVLLVGGLHFDVPFRGSYILLAFFGVIYVSAALSIGVLISTLVRTQLVAMMAALMVTVMPSVMLSGFIFEIKNMPWPLQYISNVVPARHFVVIIRDIMLKGVGVGALWQEVAALIALTVLLLGIAARSFKLRLG